MNTYCLDPHLLKRRIRVLVVGCGGNGSAFVSGLPYLHQALLAFDHPGGLQVTLVDPDTVSESNCYRQAFCRSEIGLSKAIVLAHRTNLFWRLDWKGMQASIEDIRSEEADFVIGCVDTRKARRAIDKWTRQSRVLCYLDMGNSAHTGQMILGEPRNDINRKKSNRLPVVGELYPEILSADGKGEEEPSCSAAESLIRQEPFVNQVLAIHSLALLTQLLRHGSITHQGAFCNLKNGNVTPVPVQFVQPAKRRRKAATTPGEER